MPTEARLRALFADLEQLPLPAEGSWLPEAGRVSSGDSFFDILRQPRRLPVALAVSLLLLLAVASTAIASGGLLDQIRDFAHSIGLVLSGPAGTALAVDDITIDSKTIALHETAIERNGVPPQQAHQQAIDKAIADALTLREAARRGLTASDAEIDAFIAQQRELTASAPAENEAMFQATLEGLGMTEDEYWASAGTRGAIRSIILHGKLVDALTPPGGTRLDGEHELARVIAELKQKAVIRYVQ